LFEICSASPLRARRPAFRESESVPVGTGFSTRPRRLDFEERRVIRVPVPIDIGTIAATANSAFALATPIRVDRLIALAVIQAGGFRAPQEKRERNVRATLEGFRAGRFVVDVDGRTFDRPETVVVCSGVATLRFFSTEPARRERETAL
jgi:hypothetical protein